MLKRTEEMCVDLPGPRSTSGHGGAQQKTQDGPRVTWHLPQRGCPLSLASLRYVCYQTNRHFKFEVHVYPNRCARKEKNFRSSLQ